MPTPAECGGVPDPYALLETVRRVRAEGGRPRLLVLSVADDPTATVPPPEVLHEAVEAAADEGLHVVSDESWRDTLHHPHDTVLVGPAEMDHERVTVLCDLAGALLPPALPAAVARFPATAAGAALRARTLDVVTALGARVAAPVAGAAAYALGEPDEVTGRLTADAACTRAWPPPPTARCSARAPWPGPRRRAGTSTRTSAPCAGLAARGVGTRRTWRSSSPSGSARPPPAATASGTNWAPCGYGCPRDRSSGRDEEEQTASLTAVEPLELPHVAQALSIFEAALDELR